MAAGWLIVAAVALVGGAYWFAGAVGSDRALAANEARLLQRDPPAAMAHRLGEAAFDRGDFPEAKRGFETAARLESRSAQAWLNLGIADGRLGLRAEAVDALNRAVRLRPCWGLAWQNLADACADQNDFPSARAAAEKATRFGGGSADAWIMRGHIAVLEGRAADAVRFSRRAVKLAPGRAVTWLALGDSLLAVPGSGQAAEAEEAFRKAASIEPNVYVFRRLGEAQQRAGRPADAVASLREAVGRAPGDPAAASALSQALQASGSVEEGRQWAAKAGALQERRYRLISLERRAQQSPGNAELQSRLAREYVSQGNPQAAVEAYRRALALRPNDEATRRALARLESGAG